MTCCFEMDRSVENKCCDPNYANGGVLEVKEELQREIKYQVNNEVGYFGQFTMRLENEKRI